MPVADDPLVEPAAVAPTDPSNDSAVELPAAAPRPKPSLFSRVWFVVPRTVFALMYVATLGVLFFIPQTWGEAATYAGLFFGLYLLRGFGITAGYHRYFAHRSYQTGRVFQFCLAWFGAMAVQRGPIWWAGHHRTHHKHSDQEGDPHSPILDTIWYSHVGWIISDNLKDADAEIMRDWKKYPELWWLDRFDWVPGVLTAVFCYAVAGWGGFFWGFLLSTVVLYHATFCVNSVCHLVGKRRFETSDRSRNNWLVALYTLGEGWHNNHHHYPSAARQGFKWYEFDLSYCILKTLSLVGVVWNLRQPTPRALQAKLIRK